MNNRILAIIFSLFVLANNVFADKESDAFLERAAKNTKGERILLGHKAKMGATYTNNEFRMEYTLTVPELEDVNLIYLKDQVPGIGDRLILEALILEKMHSGFAANMVKSNAGFVRELYVEHNGVKYSLPGEGMRNVHFQTLTIADTAKIPKWHLDVELAAAPTYLPVKVDKDKSLNRLFLGKYNLVAEFLVDERTLPLSRIEGNKDTLTAYLVNSLKKLNFAQYTMLGVNAEYGVVMRMKSSKTGRYSDIQIPLSEAKEIFSWEKINKDMERTSCRAKVKDDSLLSFEFTAVGEAKRILHDFDSIGKLELLSLEDVPFDEDEIKEMTQESDVRINLIYKNPTWGDDIVREVSLKDAMRRNNDSVYADSITLALGAELYNLYWIGWQMPTEVERHSYDGKNYVIDFFMQTPLNSPEQGVENMLKPEYKYFLWKKYRHVVKVLRRTKTDILLRAKNPITNIFPPYGLSKPEIVKWAKKTVKVKTVSKIIPYTTLQEDEPEMPSLRNTAQ